MSLVQCHYRFGFNDSLTADPDNINFTSDDPSQLDLIDFTINTPVHLRIQTYNDAKVAGLLPFQLYYNTSNNPATAIQVTTSSSVVSIVDDPYIADATITDDYSVIYDETDDYIWDDGYFIDASDETPALNFFASNYIDFQFNIQFDDSVIGGTTYYFFLRRNSVVLDTYNAVPSITIISSQSSSSSSNSSSSSSNSSSQSSSNSSSSLSSSSSTNFEDLTTKLRLAQEFDVNREFLPSKATVYLKRNGNNRSSYWPIYNDRKNVIDATNFSTVTSAENIVYFSDIIGDFSGNGYMILDGSPDPSLNVGSLTYPVINYPIRAIEEDTFYFWMRVASTESNVFQAEILIDGNISKTINTVISDPSGDSWSWVSTTIVLPDTSEHILGIKIKEKGAAIDKIYMDTDDVIPYNVGSEYSPSPYLTVHMKVYNEENGIPFSPLFIYDYKNTIDDIIIDDWYNFNIKTMDNNHGYIDANNFGGNYFLVMSTSGGNFDNFITWEMVDNDEYLALRSEIRI